MMVWGIISCTGLSELHIIPPKQSVNTDYHANEILASPPYLPLSIEKLEPHLRKGNCVQRSRKLFHTRLHSSTYRHKVTKWPSEYLTGFWAKGIWPNNSPDINPTENLLSSEQSELDKKNEIFKSMEWDQAPNLVI